MEIISFCVKNPAIVKQNRLQQFVNQRYGVTKSKNPILAMNIVRQSSKSVLLSVAFHSVL